MRRIVIHLKVSDDVVATVSYQCILCCRFVVQMNNAVAALLFIAVY